MRFPRRVSPSNRPTLIVSAHNSPHNDKQAQDRAYRIGQTREVKIIRLVTRGSLDENMLELATAKLQLDAEVSSRGEGDAAAGGEEAEAAATGQAERRMKKSLLSGLKKQFEREATTNPTKAEEDSTTTTTTKETEPATKREDGETKSDVKSEETKTSTEPKKEDDESTKADA